MYSGFEPSIKYESSMFIATVAGSGDIYQIVIEESEIIDHRLPRCLELFEKFPGKKQGGVQYFESFWFIALDITENCTHHGIFIRNFSKICKILVQKYEGLLLFQLAFTCSKSTMERTQQ